MDEDTPAISGKQRRLAHIVNSGEYRDQKDAALQAGYSLQQARNPGEIFASRGFLAAMAQHGLTEDLIASSLVADIEAKPGNRARELELGADILRMRKRDVEDKPTINIAVFNDGQLESIAKRYLERRGMPPEDVEQV
jgi:hypothetical protein